MRRNVLIAGLLAVALASSALGAELKVFGGKKPAAAPPPPNSKTVFITATGNWTVPSDFTSTNTVWAWGGGAGGGGGNTGSCGAGGAGAEATIANITLTPGALVPVTIGAGGAGGANTANSCGVAGGDTNFNSGQVIAKGGSVGGFTSGGPGATGGAGGQASASTPSATAHSGGAGGSTPTSAAGGAGGGGAGGPHGNGAQGSNLPNVTSSVGGSGGGGADGGGTSPAVSGTNGTAGGLAQDGTAGGTAGVNGGPGSHGSGGGASNGAASPANTGNGGNGGAGVGFTQTSDSSVAGPGGGGGGAGAVTGTGGGTAGNGGNGGLFGGGGAIGGAGPAPGAGGSGAAGGIVVTYTTGTIAAPQISGPTGTVTTSATTVTGTGNNVGDTITVYIDGGPPTPPDGTTTVVTGNTWSFNTVALGNGAHNAVATETTALGTSGVSNQVNWNTSVAAPPGNTLNPNNTASSVGLDSTRLIATVGATTPLAQTMGAVGYTSGRYHYEAQLGTPGNFQSVVGVGNTAHGLTTGVGSDVNSIGYYGSNGSGQGQILYNNVAQISNTALNANAGDLWAVEVDLTNGLFWAQDVTTGSKWNGSASANPGTGVGGVSFATSTAGCTAPCSWFVDAQLVGIVGRTVTVNFGASTFTAQCSTGFIPWNGTTACPAAPPPNQSGPGTVTAVSLLPSNVPVASSSNTWHTTARPWTAAAVANSTYLTRLNNLVTWYASRANSGTGCIGSSGLDPYTGTSNAGTAFNGSLELSFGAQFKGNNLTYATNGLATAVMNCSTASYHAHTSAQDFNIGPLNLAWQLYNTYGGASFSASQKSTWLDTNHLNAWYGVGNNTNNWGMYDMWGAWLAIQNGLSTFTGGSVGGTAGIDCMWTGATCSFNTFTMHQANQFNNPPFDLYMDQNGVTPDGLWVERQATTLNAMISEGYNGAQAGAIRTATSTAALSGMYMQAQDGESASGGRQDHHNWVEHARILTDEIMAQQVGASDSFRAGQFEHAAQMDFKVTGNWLNPACCNGATFFATKAHYNPNTACCQQYAPASGGDYGYGLQLMYLLAAAYTNKTASAITEQPMPSEIGGYAFATNSDFGPQVVMAAGGTGLQAAMAGSTANTTFDNPTLWTAVGIEKIGRVGWDARIGPADTGYPSLGGQVSFGPTWNNGSWTRLAQNPASCHGTFTTTFANPAVTFGKIVWNCGTPTFTQNLTLTPDGVLSQTTCTGCSGLWGMTFPIMTSDGDSGSWGTTTMTTNINAAGGFASTTYGPTGDTQNYITLSSNATTMTSEANVNAQGGNITPVRTYTGSPDATQTTFVYPQKSGEPTAAAVRSGMTIPAGTTNQYSNTALNSSVTSGNNGTYYIGPLAAGGWANSITIGSSTINFTSGGTATPCYFIMNLSGGNVTSIEVDRTITASIPNGAHGNYTGANTLSLTAYNPRTNL